MTSPHATINFPGNHNQGSQVGVNSGNINNYYGGVPEQQAKREPFSTVPFNQDPHFVDRGDTLEQIHEKCSYPAARVALVGLGGVGKSQLAIQYSYQVRRSSPQTWVFWVHASTGARFEEGYKLIADRLELPGRDGAQVNILQLVSNWLCDERNGRWVMIVDNADGAATFFNQTAGQLVGQPGRQSRTPPSLATFLPQTQNGCILFTSRSGDVAFKLTGSRKNIIKVGLIDQG
ncbi:hypothetical protein W97_09262 [Coniosporium apollinis CBS 100218]|uniref:NB-ARC domain-containing protein n=1 Tax=Coniosporium apollinis (strain CBS 100218) TaxID=1168221 RepID=R7Z7T0_CONA1|nr:uncharacterized protein W97_09262 [Coniosporium apollinis CBS 100218]EON69996.1 hypothetical protein W97_09262 [Coniosporium apollinis CBS 100218]